MTKKSINQQTCFVVSWSREIFLRVDGSSAGLGIIYILWDPEVHYRVKFSKSRGHVLSHLNPVLILTPYSCKVHFNIIFLSMPESLKWFLSFRLLDEHLICLSSFPHACYMFRPSHPPSLDHLNIWSRAQFMMPSLCNFLSSVTICISPDSLLIAFFSNILQVLHPNKQRNSFIFLHNLIFIFLERKHEYELNCSKHS
jgi:hypothetical protein